MAFKLSSDLFKSTIFYLFFSIVSIIISPIFRVNVPICGYGKLSKNRRSNTSHVILGANNGSDGIFNSNCKVVLMFGFDPFSKGYVYIFSTAVA